MKHKSVHVNALNESNENGGYYFMSLRTEKRVYILKQKELPIDDWVIENIENIAKEQDQPILRHTCQIFEWIFEIPIRASKEEDK